MQSTIKTASVLPNLYVELDIILRWPSDGMIESDPSYRQQPQADFRVRRGRVLAWLRYLKAKHLDYRCTAISPDRTRTLPADSDTSSSITSIIDDSDVGEDPGGPRPHVTDEPPPNSQSMVRILIQPRSTPI
jgi:hypothetical protein